MRWEVWTDGEQVEGVLTPAGGARELTAKGLLSIDARLLFGIDAGSFEEAMAIYYLRMGWDPYRPVGVAELCPSGCGSHFYPAGSGQCPVCGPHASR